MSDDVHPPRPQPAAESETDREPDPRARAEEAVELALARLLLASTRPDPGADPAPPSSP
jgi:hypothetical protein